MQQIQLAEVDEPIAHRAAVIGNSLSTQGRRMNTTDLLIAGTALVRGLTLVTPQVQDFAQVPGLTVVDWLIS
jgi:tRNA(fMet)-specific endonuclease VapC